MTISLQRPGNDADSRYTYEGVISGNPFSMVFDTNRPTQRYILEILLSGLLYEDESTRAIAGELHAGDVFFDVGANCGWFSCIALACGANVVAFEPDEQNCEALRDNAHRAEIIQAAVTDESGDAMLFVNLDNDGGHSLWPCGRHPHNIATQAAKDPKRPVRAVCLDDVGVCPHVIKIDTEGAECNVLMGAQRILANKTLRMVVCERHAMGLALMRHSPEEVEGIMRRHGFRWEDPVVAPGNVGNWIFRRP